MVMEGRGCRIPQGRGGDGRAGVLMGERGGDGGDRGQLGGEERERVERNLILSFCHKI